MLRCPDIPLLPGTVFRDIGKTKYHLSHHWERLNGTPILAEAHRTGIGGTPFVNVDGPPFNYPSLYPPYVGPKIPSWIEYDRKVLCFYAYFKENLEEMYKTPYQIRKVKILYYLEDGTLQVSEPRIENSGLSQGCIVSRKRVPRQPPCQNEFISLLELNVNKTIVIFNRTYFITGCDPFTRNFLNRAGIAVSENADGAPPDPSYELRKEALKSIKKIKTAKDTLGQFLENDRKILRFDAYWDDRQSTFGDVRNLILYYFLADDTIQIQELYPKNAGRDTNSILLRRQKLPKSWDGMPMLGEQTQYTVLNVLSTGFLRGRFIPDSVGVGTKNIKYYKDSDLMIGNTLNVFGRPVVLIDCDEYTKTYYKEKYGIDEFSALKSPTVIDELDCEMKRNANRLKNRKLPIFNGWGTHEDSEGNCRTVEPKPPHADFNKFLHLDRFLLRFGAKMLSKHTECLGRIFIITFYLSDDTISVYELASRNSGFKGGDFFKRGKFFLPNQEWFTSERPLTYTPQHFYIGATLCLRDFTFHLVSADEFCLNYMENHPFEFTRANIELIMNKIKTALEKDNVYKEFIANLLKLVTIDHNNDTICCSDDMRSSLINLLGDDISDHEIITLLRYFGIEHKAKHVCDKEMVRSVVHLDLLRGLWSDMDRLREHLIHIDPTKSKYMNEITLRSAILACRLPLKDVIISKMFSVLNKNADCQIELEDFFRFIDIINCKTTPIQPLNHYIDVCPEIKMEIGRYIDWDAFIEKIGLEEKLKQITD